MSPAEKGRCPDCHGERTIPHEGEPGDRWEAPCRLCEAEDEEVTDGALIDGAAGTAPGVVEGPGGLPTTPIAHGSREDWLAQEVTALRLDLDTARVPADRQAASAIARAQLWRKACNPRRRRTSYRARPSSCSPHRHSMNQKRAPPALRPSRPFLAGSALAELGNLRRSLH